jgi:hypothetical protein
MTNMELAELFLTTIFDEAEAKGHTTQVHLDVVADKFGVTDQMKVRNAADYLHSRGLIVSLPRHGGTWGMITGEGAVFVERGGETGIIRKYRENPSSYVVNIDKSTTIVGNVTSSNLSIHSADVSQTISVDQKVGELLSQIVQTLQKDAQLSKQQLADALQDIQTLKMQLSKSTKNKTTIESILATLANISSIGSLITQLTPLVLSLF